LGGGVGKRLVGEGQSIHSMGWVRKEIRILAQRATTTNKGFLFFALSATHELIIHHICYNYVLVPFIFFSSTG
jgi:hypothetical protein